MPDKEIMIQIKALEEQLAWNALDALALEGSIDEPASTKLREALLILGNGWRELAGLYERAKGKGFASTYVLPLRHAATQLDKVLAQLDQPRRAPLGQVQPISAPPLLHPSGVSGATVLTDAGLDEPVHRFVPDAAGRTCNATVRRGDGAGEQCGRFASHPAHRLDGPTSRPGLDALIADAVAAGELPPQPVTVVPTQRANGEGLFERVTFESVVPEHIRNSDETRAYLAGETFDLDNPGCAPETCGGSRLDPCVTVLKTGGARHDGEEVAAWKRGAHDLTETDAYLRDLSYVTSEPEPSPYRTAREILESNPVTMPVIPPVPMLGQPGDAGAGYSPTYVPPGGVPFTFADLLTPVSANVMPMHISHSQIEAIGDCPTKYRGTRLSGTVAAPSVIEIPQWALIGGNIFHAAVEEVECVVQLGDSDPLHTLGYESAEALWAHHFAAAVQKIEESSPVPRSMWRASKQGAEGETWWNANGPEMIKRYLAARPREATALLPAAPATVPDISAIEVELSADVQTAYGPIPYRAILDRVTVRYAGDPNPANALPTLIIRDYKTGDRMPGDTSQLGEYANLLRLLGVPPQVRIVGTLFNARKGTWTPEVDLDAEWSAEWFTYHITQGHAQKLALTQGPTPVRPSSYCGGCAVRWACPIKGVKRP